MNKSFSMDVENTGKPKSAFGNMEGLDNILNSIVKKQNVEKVKKTQSNKLPKSQQKQMKMQEEMERLQKISSLNSFSNSDFALDTLF